MTNHKQSLILSSSGLKNVIEDNREFRFIINQKEIRMNHVYSEFISPLVSHIHHCDPTIDELLIKYKSPTKGQFDYFEDIFHEDIIRHIQDLSSGNEINIKIEEIKKMRIVSIILNNEELFEKLNEIEPIDPNDIKNIDEIFNLIDIFENTIIINNEFKREFSIIIENISKSFYKLNQQKSDKLQKLPMNVLYQIISNKQLKIESEDSLFDFINEYFENNYNEDDKENDRIKFYEEIDIKLLSEEKFKSFLMNLDQNLITGTLWQNLLHRLISNDDEYKIERIVNENESKSCSLKKVKGLKFEYKNEQSMNGIIRHFTNECGGNVHDKGIIIVTPSSDRNDSRKAKNAVDLDDTENRFASKNEPNSWLRYDFKERKVRPTHYTIRSKPCGKGDWNPRHWVIEGSNSGNGNDWKILDTRNNIEVLNGARITHTFEIQEKINEDEFYRFLRIRQTGKDASNNNILAFSALEYFGSII